MSLLVVGSVGLDTVDTPHGSAQEELGGSAVYFSLAAAHFTRVRLVGVVGTDFPRACRERLERKPIDLQGLAQVDGATFRWHGAYRERMDQARTVDVKMNVLAGYKPTVPAVYADSDYVFLANGPPSGHLHALEQVRRPKFAMADTMNYYIEHEQGTLLALMQRVDAMIMNDAEAIELSRQHNLLAAARWVCDHGPRHCVIKKGEHGSLLRGPEGAFVLPAVPHESVVDPTGAGDAFAGGLMGYLAGRDATTPEALKHGLAYGTIMASFAIEQFGPKGLENLTAQAIEARRAELIRSTHLFAP